MKLLDPDLTIRQVSSMCARVHDDLEELPRAARKAALLEVLQVCIMSPYFERSYPYELDGGDGMLRMRITRVPKRRAFPVSVHPRVCPKWPGKADQVQRRLAWEARESWIDRSSEGQEAASEMFESADCFVVDPPGASQSIWDALKPTRKDRSNNPDYRIYDPLPATSKRVVPPQCDLHLCHPSVDE